MAPLLVNLLAHFLLVYSPQYLLKNPLNPLSAILNYVMCRNEWPNATIETAAPVLRVFRSELFEVAGVECMQLGGEVSRTKNVGYLQECRVNSI